MFSFLAIHGGGGKKTNRTRYSLSVVTLENGQWVGALDEGLMTMLCNYGHRKD
jgi:hypothetical protein